MSNTSAALTLVCILGLAVGLFAADKAAAPGSALNHTVKDIDGKEVNLAEKYKGKVVLIVNVASRCGYTKQYKGLQALHDKYAERGLAVLGFPSNQFGMQEPGTEAEIKEFCTGDYGVKFDLFSKVDVKGDNATPLYKHLTQNAPPAKDAAAGKGDKGPDVAWNFEKFLIGRDGKIVARYRSGVTPEEIAKDIEAELAKPVPQA